MLYLPSEVLVPDCVVALAAAGRHRLPCSQQEQRGGALVAQGSSRVLVGGLESQTLWELSGEPSFLLSKC